MAPLVTIMQQNTGLKPEHYQLLRSDNNPTTVPPKDPERQTDRHKLSKGLPDSLPWKIRSYWTEQGKVHTNTQTHTILSLEFSEWVGMQLAPSKTNREGEGEGRDLPASFWSGPQQITRRCLSYSLEVGVPVLTHTLRQTLGSHSQEVHGAAHTLPKSNEHLPDEIRGQASQDKGCLILLSV